MDNNEPKRPTPCIAGCGFYGSEMYNNMCSKCFKDAQAQRKLDDASRTEQSTRDKPAVNSSEAAKGSFSASSSTSSLQHVMENVGALQQRGPAAASTVPRKHARSPSPIMRSDKFRSQDLGSTPSTPGSSTTTGESPKPPQTNKGRCFKCRVKVPLAKQTTNKCRCDYVFCDSHKYPDKHDCEIDFGKMERDNLAKNNPKLHEKPKGGRSFQRIDSL